MSAIPSNGLLGVSHQTSLVFRLIAALSASRSERSTEVCSTPHRPKTLAISRNVPPYASLGSTTWSPGAHTVRSAQSSAASPLANARPRTPPSRSATHSSSAALVGLPERLYSHPSRGLPTASWWYVET